MGNIYDSLTPQQKADVRKQARERVGINNKGPVPESQVDAFEAACEDIAVRRARRGTGKRGAPPGKGGARPGRAV